MSICKLFTVFLSELSSIPASAAVKTLFAFNPLPPVGTPQVGGNPTGTLLRDASGALYGTASLGGAYYGRWAQLEDRAVV